MAGAGEAVLGSAVSCFLGILLDPIKKHTSYAFEFRSKVQALKDETKNLTLEGESLHEFIEDVRGRGEVVKTRFLRWQTEADKAIADAEEVVQNGEETAQKSCSLCLNLRARYRLGKKADQVKQGVDRLREQKVILRIPNRTDISYLPAPQPIVERPLEGYEAQSRKRILKEVMDALSDPNTSMVGLYGMGGIGKTTLADAVYHQAKDESFFYKVAPAKVTAVQEIKAIQNKIAFFVIGSELKECSDDEIRACELNRRLNEILKDKKILIILDDIWSKLDLRVQVGIPTDNKGCKILMTSRSQDVLSDMGSTKNFLLKDLSEEESMSLFEQKVGVVKYREIAEEILGKCAGFPLLIVTIAGLLKDENEDLDAWEDVLTQLKLLNNDVRDKVLSVLKRSYDHLPSPETKQIFLLYGICSRSSFKLTDLLWYSFGLGLFKDYTISEARRRLKSLIGKLKDCSLLDIDEHGDVRMHDMVREVAISIAREEGLAYRNNDANELTEWPSRGDIIRCTKISMSLINIENLPENLGCPDVEFLLLFKKRWDQINIPDSVFQQTKQLKVVHLRKLYFVSMPGSLYSLENLHTLNLEDCIFSNLDAAIGQLVNLEILSFHGSFLEALPSEIGQLTRLKLLDLSSCHRLKFIPANVISKLNSLEELLMRHSFTNWEIEEHSSGSNARLSELKCLSNLASLEIFVPDVRALPGSFFSICLERYKIMIGEGAHMWNYLDFGKTKSIVVDLSASIDLLEKARNLLMEAEVVYLSGINGVTNLSKSFGFSKWKKLSIMKSSTHQQIIDCRTAESFKELKTLHISDCDKLKSLFSVSAIGSLPQLEKIYVRICNEMEAVSVVDCRTTLSFKKLKTLDISQCDKLKYLFSVSAVRSLPQLEEIKIMSCKEMEALFVVDEESTQIVEFCCLRNLDLRFLPKLRCFLDVITSKSSKTASTTTKLISLFNEKVALPSLETLELGSIDNIEMIWSSGASGVSGQLNSLKIWKCDKLQTVFPDSTQHSFHKLESLDIDRCGSLKILFPLVIAKTFSELKNLKVSKCDKLEEIVEAGEASTNSIPFHFFLQLTSLTLLELRELRSLYPFGHTSEWPNLGEVEIRGCPKTIGIGLFGEQGSPTGVGQSHITHQEKAFPNLEKMSIEGVKFSKSNLNSPSWWSHIPALKTLELFNCRGRSMLELSEVGASESLPNLRELVVHDSYIKQLWEYNKKRSSGSDSPTQGGLPSIRILHLFNVDGLRHVGRGGSKTEDPLLPSLESLELIWCSDLISLAPSPSASFQNLSTLKLDECDKVTGLINPSTARTMVNLVCLEISLCTAMEEIVAAEEDDDQSPTECIIVFNKLKTLKLENLDSLKGFCTSGCYSFNFPCLEDVSIRWCRSMRIFCNGDAIMPKLKKMDIDFINYCPPVDINTTIKLFKDELQHIESLKLSQFPHLVERWGTEDIPPFEYLYELVVDEVPLLPTAVPSNVLPSLRNLEKLVVEKCESVKEIFDLHGMDQENEHQFGVMSELRELKLTELPKLRHVWNEDPLGILGDFRNLSVLEVYNCHNLTHIFNMSVALGLVSLKTLQVKRCGLVEVIINQQGEYEKPTADRDDHCISIFPSLKTVELEDLRCLKEFCSGVDHVLICPELTRITAVGCPRMHILGGSSTGSSSTEHHPTNGIPHDETPNIPALRIFNDQVKILGLLKLDVQWNSSMDKAWHELTPRSFLHSLEYVKLTGFPADHELLPLDFVQAMPNLEKFLISDSFYKQILPRFVRDAGSLEKLTYLELFNLPELCNLIEEEGSKLVSVFQHLEVLEVSKCKRLKRLMTSATARGLINLKKIVVKDCEEMTEILSCNGDEEDSQPSSLFHHLKVLEVSKCDRLTRLLTSSTARGLQNIEELVVKYCRRITEIVSSNGVSSNGGKVGDEIAFDRLEYLELQGLSCLTIFSSGNDIFIFPLLEDMIIIECPHMKTFSKNDPDTPNLSAVQIAEIEDEDPWRWEGGLNSTIAKLYTKMNPSSTT